MAYTHRPVTPAMSSIPGIFERSPCVDGKKTFTLVLQARMASTRYPGKSTALFCGMPLVAFIQKRLGSLDSHISNFVLAVPEDEERAFEALHIPPFHLVVGSHGNVLSRFNKAFEMYRADWMIRATADNPFISPQILMATIERINHGLQADYITHDALPLGSQGEFINADAFERIVSDSTESRHFEHVTPYCYEHPESFRLVTLHAPEFARIAGLRLTFDTADDYLMLTALASHLKDPLTADLKDIMDVYLKNAEIFALNASVCQKNYRDAE